MADRAGRTVVLVAVVATVALLSYANTLGHGFVFDDMQTIVENRWIRDVRSIPAIFSTHAAGFDPAYATSYYRPVMHLTYMATYAVSGLRPWAFHLVNVLLHVLVTALAFLVARALVDELGGDTGTTEDGGLRVALVAALLFATHPVHTEAVAWLAGVTDLTFSAFGMAAVLAYRGARRAIGTVPAAAALLLAALAKEPALAIVLVFLAVEGARLAARRASPSGAAWRMLPVAVAVVVYLALRWRALGGFAPSYGQHRYGPLVAMLAAVDLVGQYVRMLVLPAPLNALHVFRPPASPLDPGVVLGAVALAVIVAVAWACRRRPVCLVALVWLVAPLLPVLYAPVLGEGVFAERYLYFPSFGFALLVAIGWSTVAARMRVPRAVSLAVPLVVVAVYAVGTVRRNPVWHDHLALWSDTVRKSPESAAAHEYFCFAQYAAGAARDAADSCRRALMLDPGRLDARINLGNALAALGDLDGAAAALDDALRQAPRSVHALTTRGLVFMASGEPDRGIASYRRALEIDPNDAEARNVLGVALARLGLVEDARREIEAAVRLAPDRPEYRENLAALLGRPVPGR